MLKKKEKLTCTGFGPRFSAEKSYTSCMSAILHTKCPTVAGSTSNTHVLVFNSELFIIVLDCQCLQVCVCVCIETSPNLLFVRSFNPLKTSLKYTWAGVYGKCVL